MNNILRLLLALSLIFIANSKTGKLYAQDVVVSYQDFYDELSPYGQWINDPDYGNVWVPNEDADFRPYSTRGRWVMTEYGNTWVSDDPWGWAVYHYGRWTYNPYYGWIWVPGYEWAPAWVSWRYGGGYCGWAPLAPGWGVSITTGFPDSWWIFVGPNYLYSPNPYRYWRGVNYNRRYLQQTTIINNIYVDNRTQVQYNYGPRASAIQQVTRQPVQVYRINNARRPGGSSIQQGYVNMYRPAVNRSTAGTARPANIMQAPRNVGRPQQADVRGNKQPEFRQEVARQTPNARNGNTGVVGPNQQNMSNQRQGAQQRGDVQRQQQQYNGANRFDGRNAEPARQNPQQQQQREQPRRFEPAQQQPQQAPREDVRRNNQPEQPQRDEPNRNNQPAREPQQQQKDDPNRNNQPAREPQQQQQQQAPREQPRRFDPPAQQPQQPPREEPRRYNPPPQQPQQPSREEPRRYNPPAPQPAPQPRPAPAPAPQPRPAPAPQQQQAPHPGPGRR